MAGEKLTWAGLRRTLKILMGTDINLENGGLKELAHNAKAARLAGTPKKPGPLSDLWPLWTKEAREKLLSVLDAAASPGEAINRMIGECGLPRDIAERVEKITLPSGHLMLGLRATYAIVQVMRGEVIVYSAAIEGASERGLFGEGVVLHHSDLRPEGDPGSPCLPRYYELPALQRMIGTGTGNPDDPPEIRFGKIANPTVHIALGQFWRVMNALIDHYGKSDQVAVETTRDMAKSARELNEIDAEIKKNTKRNDA